MSDNKEVSKPTAASTAPTAPIKPAPTITSSAKLPVTENRVTPKETPPPTSPAPDLSPKIPTPTVPVKAGEATQAEVIGSGKMTREEAIRHLQEVRDYLIKFEGKPGFNPHFQISKIDKLAQKLQNAAAPYGVINEALGFQKVEPKV